MTYRQGQKITCPHCGEVSAVTIKTKMDGWTKVGEYYACALCHAKLGDVGKEPVPEAKPDKAALDRFAKFLGTKPEEKPKNVVQDDGERRFCRDCKHYLVHPFLSRCLLHERDVSPMADCPDFERRAESKEDE